MSVTTNRIMQGDNKTNYIIVSVLNDGIKIFY